MLIGIAFLALYSVSSFYVGLRILEWLRLLFVTIHPAAYWLIYCFFVLSLFLANLLPTTIFSRPLHYISGFWLAGFLYTLLFVAAVDIVRVGIRALSPSHQAVAFPTVWSGALICVCVVSLVVVGFLHARRIRTTHYVLEPQKWTREDALRIALVSDIHLGEIIGVGQLRRIVKRINALNADIVCIAGDLFDGNYHAVHKPAQVEALLQSIESRGGIYMCLGNHDAGGTREKMEELLARANVTLLKDRAVSLECGVTLVGRKDPTPIGERAKHRAALAEIEYEETQYVIVLDHQPTAQAASEAAEHSANLMLSGHTHRGQLFPVNMITAAIFPTDYGIKLYKGMQLVVSSGAGTWGPPIRIGSCSEVVDITITRAKAVVN